MLALFGNLSPLELAVIAIVAILVFGGKLPQVAGKTFAQLRQLRRTLDTMRRETGIDSELREIQRDVEQTTQALHTDDPRRRARSTYAVLEDKGSEASGGTSEGLEPTSDETRQEDASQADAASTSAKRERSREVQDPE